MTQRKISDMQSDHKLWLKEIDRWEFYVRNWSNEHRQLLDQFAQFKHRVEQYGQDLKAHANAIEQHKREILTCERRMLEQQQGDDPDTALSEAHAKSAVYHEKQHGLHERLKQMQHTLLAQLGMLRHYPACED